MHLYICIVVILMLVYTVWLEQSGLCGFQIITIEMYVPSQPNPPHVECCLKSGLKFIFEREPRFHSSLELQ